MRKFDLEHVYESQQFDSELLDIIFNVADEMKKDLAAEQRRYSQVLNDKIMASLFYEPSTRTRFSFESAMARLGGSILTTENAKEFSSASKGETLYDSTKVMCGYADLRHYAPRHRLSRLLYDHPFLPPPLNPGRRNPAISVRDTSSP